ncbi:hypothetical protein BDW60DRAFT_139462 [Aspergillus nidulans var. acristatus]
MGENGQNPDLCQPYKNPGESSPKPAPRTDQYQQDEDIPAAHEPEIYDIEDLPPDTPGLSLKTEVVKPYAIEEPDEEPTWEADVSTAQFRQRKHWEDLVSSMEKLYCDSDLENLGSIRPKRGRKRKPTITNPVQTAQPGESAFVPDAQYASPSLSSKRARKKEELPKERYLDADEEVIIRRPRGLSSSSNASASTDTSGANLTNVFPTPDDMDLD